MNEKIYKIVDITSEYDVIINAGLEDNISDGTEFEIFAYGKEVLDPDTHESLGTLDIIKTVVEAVTVYPKMCRCRKIVVEKKQPFGMLLSEYVEVQSAKKLNIDYSDIQPNIEIDSRIKIGDLVRIKHH